MLALPAPITRAMSCSVTVVPLTSIEASNNSLAMRPAEIDTSNRIDAHLGGTLGEIDGVTDRFLGIDKIDDRAGLHAARAGVRKADHLDRVASAAQCVALRIGRQPRDQARDLAGADVERDHQRRTARRQRLHFGRQAVVEGIHTLPSLLLLGLFLDGGIARLRRGVGELNGDAVGLAQVDRNDIARRQFLVAVERGELCECTVDIVFR